MERSPTTLYTLNKQMSTYLLALAYWGVVEHLEVLVVIESQSGWRLTTSCLVEYQVPSYR